MLLVCSLSKIQAPVIHVIITTNHVLDKHTEIDIGVQSTIDTKFFRVIEWVPSSITTQFSCSDLWCGNTENAAMKMSNRPAYSSLMLPSLSDTSASLSSEAVHTLLTSLSSETIYEFT